MRRPDIDAEITLLTTEFGGRAGPTPMDRFGCPMLIDGEYFDVRFDLTETGSVSPGQTVRVPARFLSPAVVKTFVVVGGEYTLWEGRKIGSARIVAIHDDA